MPPILKGLDVIGTSQTGSGKTTTFALPILHTLAGFLWYICSTYLTRELAVQISRTIQCSFSRFNIKMPGYNWWRKIQANQNDFKTTSYYSYPLVVWWITFQTVLKLWVFSKSEISSPWQADRLLEPSWIRCGFCSIFLLNILLFSTSITVILQHYCISLNDAFHFEVGIEGLKAVSSCKQEYCFLPRIMRDAYLLHIFQRERIRSSIIFTSTPNAFLHDIIWYSW